MSHATRSQHHWKFACAAAAMALGAGSPTLAAAAGEHETIANYQGYIIGRRPVVTAWYGQRIALVIDGETAEAAAARNPQTMSKIVNALDNLFTAYDQVTGFTGFPIGRALDGRITIESSSVVGGGLAGHAVMGIAVGDGYFEGQYNRVNAGNDAYHQVFFYETSRNYWSAAMQKIDYATSNSPDSWGWWTVGFNNAMAAMMPRHPIPGISDLYYNNQNSQQFGDAMVSYLDTYLGNPAYNWENTWNVDRLPWDQNTSLNDLMSALIIKLSRQYGAGGTAFLQGLYAEVPRVPDLASDHADSKGARDNFYIAASRAAGTDLRDYFTHTLRWEISPDADANYHRWTGGAGGSWGTATNWRTLSAIPAAPDGPTINVAIDGASNPLIDLGGDRTVKTLRFSGRAGASFTLGNSVPGASLRIADGGGISKDINNVTLIQTIATPLTFEGSATITNNSVWADGGNRLILAGPIFGDGTLTFTGRAPQEIGDGGIELAGDNSGFTGAMVLESGRLIIAGSTSLGAPNAALTIRGGDLRIRGNLDLANRFIVDKTGTLSTDGPVIFSGEVTIQPGRTWDTRGMASTLAFNGPLAGGGGLRLLSTGVVTLGGTAPNTLSGTVAVSQHATLILAKQGGLAVAGPLDIANSAVVRFAADDQIADGSLVRMMEGTRIEFLNHSDQFGGLSDTANASIVENGASAPGNSVLTLGKDTTDRYSYKGTIRDHAAGATGGTLSLVKVGTNTQVLQWENQYTGPTAIHDGTLALEGIGSISSSSRITVVGGALAVRGSAAVNAPLFLEGGALTGTGRVGAPTTVTGGRISPGEGLGSAATITLGNVTMTGNSVLEFDLGDQSDRIAMTGSLKLDGTLNVARLGDEPLDGKYVIISGFTALTDNGLVLGALPAGTDLSLTVDAVNREIYLMASSQAGGASVPEPAAGAMLVMGIAFLGARGSRRARNVDRAVAAHRVL